MVRCRSVFVGWAMVGLVTAVVCAGCSRSTTPKNAGTNHATEKNFTTGRALREKPNPTAKRLIVLTNGDDPFWDAMRAGMESAGKDLKVEEVGLQVEMDKNDNTPKGQIDKLTQYANQTDIAAVAISSTDASSTQIAAAMRGLLKQGIEVITIDSDVDRKIARDARFAYLGTDNIIGGRELGKAAKGLRPDGAKYAAFVGLKTAANAQERMQGFREGAGEGFEEAEYLADDMDLSVARKNVRDALSRNPDLDLLVGIWAYNAPAIAATVKDRNIRDKTAVVTFDAQPAGILSMDEGMIDAFVVQNPYEMGYQGVRLMKALVERDNDTIKEMYPSWDPETGKFADAGGDQMITGLKVVVPSDSSPLKKEMFEESTEFLTLPAFKEWLAKYKLTGS